MTEDAPEPGRLIELLNAFLAADEPEMRRLLEVEGSILLHPAAEDELRHPVRTASEKGDSSAAEPTSGMPMLWQRAASAASTPCSHPPS